MKKELMGEEYKLTGFVAGNHYNGNSHFMDEDGRVLCGSKSRWGFDASIEIKFRSPEDFEHDQGSYTRKGGAKVWHSNHLPLHCSITCKKCRVKINALFQTEPTLNPIQP